MENNNNDSQWSEEFSDLVASIKKKRAETKRKRDNPFSDFIMPISMKIAAKTIGMDLVSVQPLATPKINLVYANYSYGETEEQRLERIKREKFEKRQRVIDSLLGKTVEKIEEDVIETTEVLLTSTNIPIDKKTVLDKWKPILGELSHNSNTQNWLSEYMNNGSAGLTL